MKTILITGATQGLGRATAQALAEQGHALILHGRNADKLSEVAADLRRTGAEIATEVADLSDLTQVAAMADRVAKKHPQIDALINNAGVLKTAQARAGAYDVRFAVNTLASALLAQRLLPVIPQDGRIIHLSSAAQAPVDTEALAGNRPLQDMAAYAQSKLAITLWNQSFGDRHPEGPVSLAVNPGSLLATRMVREGFGTSGNDLNIGVDILTRAALSEEFAQATGRYYDNDARRLAPRYDDATTAKVTAQIDTLLSQNS
ncbi:MULTISPECIES: SDR family NAD(P)-dependent oxidoreductase [unclassified Mameliella]|uniref:SDR family NAD(P)-dependent oxidoreductase n=1 Tax=unclassified Mameliella TaxID=2630630 RepID=UPI00273F065F|nr:MULTISPECIES: SDR family NAD(P)-dependent oxidoreductase [unclassified Mameliella]